MFTKFKRIGNIVIEESGVKTVWWLLVSAVPTANQWVKEHYQHSVTELLPNWFSEPQWWWGAPVLALWVIFALASRVLRDETPTLEIQLSQASQNGSLWVELKNVGKKHLKSCVLNLAALRSESGVLAYPHHFGIAKNNPFPLRPSQGKQSEFAILKNSRIVLILTYGKNNNLDLPLEDEVYTATIVGFSEADGAHCEKEVKISRRDGILAVT